VTARCRYYYYYLSKVGGYRFSAIMNKWATGLPAADTPGAISAVFCFWLDWRPTVIHSVTEHGTGRIEYSNSCAPCRIPCLHAGNGATKTRRSRTRPDRYWPTPSVGAVFCSWVGWHPTGGRLPFRHRTRDRPHDVRAYDDWTLGVVSRAAADNQH